MLIGWCWDSLTPSLPDAVSGFGRIGVAWFARKTGGIDAPWPSSRRVCRRPRVFVANTPKNCGIVHPEVTFCMYFDHASDQDWFLLQFRGSAEPLQVSRPASHKALGPELKAIS